MLKKSVFLPIVLVIQIFFYIFATNKKYNIMASKNVLSEAINKLVSANAILLEKSMKDKANAENYRKEITKNQSMILDYKFRLEHE